MTSLLEGRFRIGDAVIGDEDCQTSRVYLGEDLQTGKPVAIKILIQVASKGAEFRSRFQRDADIMRSFDHPNVVKTLASGVTPDGQPYFAMEFLQGQTLAARIAERGPIDPADMAKYLAQVASALDAAHARGIVHRDINPNAVMILEQPTEDATVKLLDFGLAKDLSKTATSELEMTGKQTILGKAAYLSPEQARGGEVDRRSDVYALGVTLYEALTGRLPFEGETDFQILLAQINGNVPPFPKHWSNHPGASAVEMVVLKALAKAPADRPATSGILANLFQQALVTNQKPKLSLSWPVIAAGVVVVTSVLILARWLF
jgi:serine/threonine-protein kinase